MDDVSGQAAGGFFIAVVTGVIAALAKSAAKATGEFIVKWREDQKMADRKREEEEAAQASENDPVMALIRDLTEANAENERLRRDMNGLGDDMLRLADAKAMAEKERDDAIRMAEAAVAKERELREEIRGKRLRPAKETYVEKPSGEPRHSAVHDRTDQRAGSDSDSAGNRPASAPTLPPVRGKGPAAK